MSSIRGPKIMAIYTGNSSTEQKIIEKTKEDLAKLAEKITPKEITVGASTKKGVYFEAKWSLGKKKN